jgi:hypothetical protein
MQDEYKVSMMGEHAHNMNGGSYAFIADSAKINHKQVVKSKVVNETARTERTNEALPKLDITKNFSRLPKTHWVPQPNNFGNPVVDTLYKKAGAKGQHKGGNHY